MYDNRTEAGRAIIRKDVEKRLGKTGKVRGDIAAAMGDGVTPRMVSDALRWLEARGKATRNGPRNRPEYSKAVSK